MARRLEMVAVSPSWLEREIETMLAEIENGGAITTEWLTNALPWEGFPRKMRLLYLAQRGLCGICEEIVWPGILGVGPDSPSWEHVVPRAHGGRGIAFRNLLITHWRCNGARGSHPASPRMLEFCHATHKRLEGFIAIRRPRRSGQK